MIKKVLKSANLFYLFNIFKKSKEEIPENNKEDFNIEDIYTSLSVAKEEIWRRWNDKELRKKVEKFIGGNIPEFLKEKPRAYLARHVASPNNEFIRFVDMAKLCDLEPICLEYLNDKFRTENEDKYYLGKLTFYSGIGKGGGYKVTGNNIIPFNESENKLICNINTIWGEKLTDFHHNIFNSYFPEHKNKFIDMSEWVYTLGSKSEKYYLKYLSIFITQGILFENFISKKNHRELEFTKNIVLPCVRKIYDEFGLKPLIIALNPIEDEDAMYFRYYPNKIKNILVKLINKNK